MVLLRGAGDRVSIVGVKRCDDMDYGLLGILFFYQLVMTAVAIYVAK